MSEAPPFRDPTLLSRIAMGLLAAHGLGSLWLTLSIAFRTWILDSATLFAMEGTMLTLLQVVYLLNIVAFLSWFYRVYANLAALGGAPTRSAGFAVGCWFIPIGGLWLPCQTATEIWRESAGPPSHDPDAPSRERGGSLVIAWWTFFIGRVFVNAALSLANRQFADLETINTLALGSNAMMVIAAVLAILLVLRVTRRQLETAGSSGPLVF